jgi:hypothetical protein
MNFHVGQKVVYIGPDREFDPNPGKTVHVVLAIKKSSCKCQVDDIWTGKYGFSSLFFCQGCGTFGGENDTKLWKGSDMFRPLIDDYTEEEIEAVNIDEVLEPLCEPA